MSSNRTQFTNIDEYIASFPPEVQKILQELRAVIRSVAPDAGEKISYAVPTFTLHGNLVHFGGFTNHISLFPGSAAGEYFKDELVGYITSKGTIQFPLNKPMPYDLIRRIVAFCVQENMKKAASKSKKKS